MAHTLNQGEIDALMQAIQAGQIDTDLQTDESGVQFVPYDLTSPDRIIRGQMPTLDSINDQIASNFAAGLAGRIRTQVRVHVHPATLLKFVDFNPLLAPPSTVAVIDLGDGFGTGVLILESGVGDSLLSSALGEKWKGAEPSNGNRKKEMTGVEKGVLARVLTVLTDAMSEAWSPVLALKPKVLRFESDPRLAMVAQPNDVAILSTFELAGVVEGKIQIGIPFAAVESVKKRLTSTPRGIGGGNSRFTARLASELLNVKVKVIAELGRTRFNLSDLMALREGDVIALDTDESSPVPLIVEGRHKHRGKPTVQNGAYALALDGQWSACEGELAVAEVLEAKRDARLEAERLARTPLHNAPPPSLDDLRGLISEEELAELDFDGVPL